MREERQADAGLSQMRRPAWRASSRISCLVSPALQQRSGDVVLLGGLLAGAEVALIVEVHAVGNRVEAARGAERFPSRQKVRLCTESSAGRRCAYIRGDRVRRWR